MFIVVDNNKKVIRELEESKALIKTLQDRRTRLYRMLYFNSVVGTITLCLKHLTYVSPHFLLFNIIGGSTVLNVVYLNLMSFNFF